MEDKDNKMNVYVLLMHICMLACIACILKLKVRKCCVIDVIDQYFIDDHLMLIINYIDPHNGISAE